MSIEARRCLGIRGAITVEANTREAILAAAYELMTALIEANQLEQSDVGGIFFSATADLDAEYPAVAVRQMGWRDAAIMCGQEMSVSGSLPMCLRVMVMWNTTRAADQIRHIYLRGAQVLRPDRAYHP